MPDPVKLPKHGANGRKVLFVSEKLPDLDMEEIKVAFCGTGSIIVRKKVKR